MGQNVDTKEVLSGVVSHMKYAKHVEGQDRREVWGETTNRSRDMHVRRFPFLEQDINEAFSYVGRKEVLQSMRSAQFAGKAIETKPNRIYNCAYNPIDGLDSIRETFFNLLCRS